jgi:two-component system response regulator GlrR
MTDPRARNGADAVTDIQADPLGYTRTALRRCHEVRWTDARGAHAVALDRRMLVGTTEGTDITLADPTVSRLHAEFEPRDDGVWIHDRGSRNGTFVHDVLVKVARVPPGAIVRLGSTALTVHDDPLPAAVDLWPSDTFGPLAGRSVAMRELFARLARVAGTGDATVLITGETGTGKELVAHAVHEASPRADKPFVIVDCAALPENLLEVELFGHRKGAFTGATDSRAGAIETADGGTVFLDEIGELPLAMQPKLLRALESSTVRRLGETAHRKVDVRFIAATHRDLVSMVNAGAFREDLYFRLAVVPVLVPPLREHPEDISVLVARFLPPGASAAMAPELLAELATRPWLGNVRELRNFVTRAVALGAQAALAMTPGRPSNVPAPPREAFPAIPYEQPFKEIRERWVDHLEREYIRELLARHNRNTTAVAQAAGLDRAYIYRLMKKHDL